MVTSYSNTKLLALSCIRESDIPQDFQASYFDRQRNVVTRRSIKVKKTTRECKIRMWTGIFNENLFWWHELTQQDKTCLVYLSNSSSAPYMHVGEPTCIHFGDVHVYILTQDKLGNFSTFDCGMLRFKRICGSMVQSCRRMDQGLKLARV